VKVRVASLEGIRWGCHMMGPFLGVQSGHV
jgi:hypothetical protein